MIEYASYENDKKEKRFFKKLILNLIFKFNEKKQ